MKDLTLSDIQQVNGGNPAIAFTTALTLTKENYEPQIAISVGSFVGLSVSCLMFIGMDKGTLAKNMISTVIGSAGGYLLGHLIAKN